MTSVQEVASNKDLLNLVEPGRVEAVAEQLTTGRDTTGAENGLLAYLRELSPSERAAYAGWGLLSAVGVAVAVKFRLPQRGLTGLKHRATRAIIKRRLTRLLKQGLVVQVLPDGERLPLKLLAADQLHCDSGLWFVSGESGVVGFTLDGVGAVLENQIFVNAYVLIEQGHFDNLAEVFKAGSAARPSLAAVRDE